MAGATKSGDFPTKNTSRTSYQGLQDAFALRLGADGDVLRWSQYLGGTKADGAGGVALGAADSVVVGGFTSSSDMPDRRRRDQPVLRGRLAGRVPARPPG